MATDYKSQSSKIFFLLIILVALSVFFFRDSITLFPSFIHAWTQSDRYALVYGFLNNGFDFFHPQTLNLATIDGITRVDFPIHEYIVALLMKVTGIHSPVVFRIYILSYAIVGLLFLFRISSLFSNSFLKNIFAALFIFGCPVFLYYADGFIPSIPSLSNLFIGYFFFFRYKTGKSKRDFRLAVIFMTLAALARLPFFIFLFAVFLQQLFFYLRSKSIAWNEVRAFAISFLIFAGYQLYNSWLGKKYGSQFLVNFLPPANSGQALEWISATWSHWRFEYFTRAHYIILILLLAIFLFELWKKKIILRKNDDLLLHIGIAGCGSVIYFFVMLQQFPDHDYYFIDAFYPIVSLLLIFLLSWIPSNKIFRYSIAIALTTFLFLSMKESKEIQNKRYETGYWDRVETTRKNYEGSAAFLDSIGISKDEKVLVLDGYTTNVPLMLMNRKGLTVNWTTYENIEAGMSKPFNFVAIQNDFIASDVLKNDPQLIQRLRKIADNGLISIYRKSNNQNQTEDQFFGLDSATTRLTKLRSDSVFVDSGSEFIEIINDSVSNLLLDRPTKILLRAKFLRKNNAPQLIASVSNAEGTKYYSGFDLNDYTINSSDWQNLLFQFVIPPRPCNTGNIKVYFWNNQKSRFYLKDLKTFFYR